MADVPVTFTVQAGQGVVVVAGGAANTATVHTGADGVARIGWLTGTTAGSQAVDARVGGLVPVLFTVEARPGPPAMIHIESGDYQTGTVGLALSTLPAVRLRDAHGNATPGIEVAFAPVGASGSIAAARATTDAAGMATPGTWILGTRAGTQRLTVTVDGAAPVELTATAQPGPAVRLERLAGNDQSATVNTAVAVPPAVVARDAWDNAVPGAAVTFTIISGGGSISGFSGSNEATGSVTHASGPSGSATVPGWVLGRIAGANQLRATLGGGTSVDFVATGRAGVPAVLRIREGQGQSAPAGTPLAIPPAVFVGDAFDNPITEIVVGFSISAGGGSVSQTSVPSDALGIASPGAWTLGSAAGPNALQASVPGLPAATFTATALGGGGGGGAGSGGASPASFDIDLRMINPVSATQQAAFNAAAARWTSAITGDLPAVPLSVPAGACGIAHPAITETVDDLLVLISVEEIDGPGKVLGSAGPCFLRSASGLPVLGIILLDSWDLAMIEANGMLTAVIMHEMGHVLGVGTLWRAPPLIGAGSTDPYFTGGGAVSEFLAAGGSTYPGSPVPVENTGGGGTRDGHWRESVFGSELMTGWINGGANPLSAITIASLGDIGFTVDVGAADGFSVSSAAAAHSDDRHAGIELQERRLPVMPVAVDAHGRRVSAAAR
ncbi:MAG: hypothetical protein L0271_16565 [Gemmatimonadetes bacterium]|nr:hypothetical protein [Gemmatimonadota bacterium]